MLIPTAANPLRSAPFVEAAAQLLRHEGMTVERLDLQHTEPSTAERALRTADLVFVTGGYAIFLLQHVHRTRFDQVLRQAVTSGRTAYVGISAGAALAGPDLRFFRDTEDPGRVVSTTGLGLVPFTVLPHRNRDNAERHDRHTLRHDRQVRFISINDDQAVAVHATSWKIQQSP
ncbi:Type 1 glutamine amidotransferase-like domain-containing protein [Actinomadura violacea]|uniref:Type 1 glutamine amidotransferase-like domain-containing protein n=1 Tax=Actinomadura violacea TaxID=2819934 RepID=A0ABS3RMY5_9ACTN|nr:Type 1 glutamine amidotransferase-like domain-containing protein [Actinomadura violacea]MBO2458104.1 Type 1 glutamine amidotransferase-like domain-containing protein [Actinomadura violacea]